MNEPPVPKLPGAFRVALFQDVPYILDSLWRWTEFRFNRLGSVELEGQHRFILRPAWKCGAFLMFALVGLFAIFGPTWDALCSLKGFGFAREARNIASLLLYFAAALLFARVLNSVTFHLTRRADALLAQHPATDPDKHGPFSDLAKTANQTNKMLRGARAAIDRRAEENIGNLRRFFNVLPKLQPRDGWTLFLGLLMLMLGAALVVAPIVASAYGFRHGETDPMSCSQLDHTGLVVAQFVALVVALVGGLLLWRRLARAQSFAACVALTVLLALLIGALWMWFTPDHPSEAAGGFYPHVYLLLVGGLMAIALFARLLAHIMFWGFGPIKTFRDALVAEDLLRNQRDAPDISNLRLWSALINGVTGHLLHFMLLPAFVAFVAPSVALWLLVWSFIPVSIILLMYGSLSSRWEQMLVYVDRWFLVGTPLIMSVAVIAVAAMRLAEVQYVATVLDATPVGVLFIFIVMMYVAFWLFEYWINRWIGEKLLGVLGPAEYARQGYVPCAYDPKGGTPWASVQGRVVALHGTGRFVAQGWFERAAPLPGERKIECAFTTYSLVELFDVLAARLDKGADLARDVRRRVHLYFTLLNGLLIAGAVGLFFWHLNWSRPLAVTPMVDAQAIKPELATDAQLQSAARNAVDGLATRLLAQANQERPALIVAASGGGTRAAVYTAVALEGMGQIDRARDVVLLSGVSGGGVSAAVFASRFAELRSANPRDESVLHPGPWWKFVAAVSQPFIQDVLEGSGELRIAGSSSLGVLLQESLERRAFATEMTGIQTFAELHDPALILNTAISGHPYNDSDLLKGRVAAPPAEGPCVEQARPYANLAGGRLIFTNLTNVSGFPQPATDVPDMWMLYRIVNDGNVRLSQAAALTANFPPVFSNARVRLASPQERCAQSYFVTDGGATENLGLVSALFALRGTINELPASARLSDIHVLALEASAIDYDYRDDRGVGAATGGSKERINAGLTQTLIKELGALVAAHGAVLRVHYLPLPVAFRSRGGFGTHWMFARNISVTNPLLAAAPSMKNKFTSHAIKDQVDLNRNEVMVTLRALFDPREPICLRAEKYHKDPKSAPLPWTMEVELVARWICGQDDARGTEPLQPDYQVEAWGNVIRELGRL